MSTLEALSNLLGKDLRTFKLEEMYDIWATNEDGTRTTHLGAFKNETIAKAFAGNEKKIWGTKIDKILVLTDGNIGFVFDTDREIKLFDDEAEAVKLKEVALNKLSPEDRELLKV